MGFRVNHSGFRGLGFRIPKNSFAGLIPVAEKSGLRILVLLDTSGFGFVEVRGLGVLWEG